MEKIKALLTKEVIIGAVIVALLLCCLMLFLQVGVFPYLNANANQKAYVHITPAGGNNSVEQNSIEATPTLQVHPGEVVQGNVVVVNGTGEDGLRMRSEPGTEGEILFIAGENEYFNVIDGPVIRDNLIWWKIQSLSDSQKTGWSAQDYLASIQP